MITLPESLTDFFHKPPNWDDFLNQNFEDLTHLKKEDDKSTKTNFGELSDQIRKAFIVTLNDNSISVPFYKDVPPSMKSKYVDIVKKFVLAFFEKELKKS